MEENLCDFAQYETFRGFNFAISSIFSDFQYFAIPSCKLVFRVFGEMTRSVTFTGIQLLLHSLKW